MMTNDNIFNNIMFKRLDNRAIIPEKGTKDSACWDLFALEDMKFPPGAILLVKTGWACQVSSGYRPNIYVRSSTPIKKNFILANGIGVVDSDYRGELMVQLMNVKTEVCISKDFGGVARSVALLIENEIKAGDKIAQLEMVPDAAVGIDWNVQEVNVLSETQRGSGGFGSTG